MLKSLIAAFLDKPRWDHVVEGLYADQHGPEAQSVISAGYRARWTEPSQSPQTHPWLYDPCDPPEGWRYDPYYELWIEVENL